MRIGINTFALSERLGMAGSGRYILGLVRALARLDHGHELILFGNADNLRLLPSDGCRRVDCGRLTTVRPLRLFWEQSMLPLMARRYALDLLHSPVFVAPLSLLCASVVTILDMTWFSLPEQHTRTKGAYFRSMIPRSIRRAAQVLAISETTRQDIIAVLGTPADKVTVTHLGVDLSRFHPDAAQSGVEQIKERHGIHQPFVLFVGKLEPRKNLPVLIEAFSSVAQEFPEHELVLAGSPGWDYETIYQAVNQVPCAERIRFTGFVGEDDLPMLYAGADLFVYPSSYEGFGFPVLEAMACGTPVITSNVSSLPEVAGDAGLLVDPLDATELAEAMRRVLADDELRQQMRAKGLERAKQFTWEAAARRTLRVYQDAYSLAQGPGIERPEEKRLAKLTDYAAKTGYQKQDIAETYESKRFFTPRGRLIHSLELRAVQKALAQAAPMDRVLDLPCGTARLTHPLLIEGFNMWGADISGAMLQQAKIKLMADPDAGGVGRLVRCDAEALPYANGTFDCVVSLRFMCHTPPETRRHILGEMSRIARRWLVVAFYISDPIFRVKRALRRAISRPYSAYPVTWRDLDQDLASIGLGRISTFPVARFHLSETHILLLSVQ